MIEHRAIVAKRRECPPGSWVQSNYRAHWRGVIVKLIARPDSYDLAHIEMRLDRRGNPMRKRRIRVLDHAWLSPVTPPE